MGPQYDELDEDSEQDPDYVPPKKKSRKGRGGSPGNSQVISTFDKEDYEEELFESDVESTDDDEYEEDE